MTLHAESLVNEDPSENKDASLEERRCAMEKGTEKERAKTGGERKRGKRGRERERCRVILPLPVISDICISLSLTVLRRNGDDDGGGSDLHANGPTLCAAKMTAFS